MDFKVLAEQLCKPDGDFGKKVAENMNLSNAQMNLEAIKQLKIQSGDNILEIGMGNGEFVKNILAQNPDVKYTGADFSDAMIEESISRNRKFTENGQASFIQCQAATLPFLNDYFTKVLTVNTIYFWKDPGKELAEIQRVLQPRGKLIIGIRPKRNMEKYPFTLYGFTLYSKTDIIALLQNHHFLVGQITEIVEPEQKFGDIVIKPEFIIIEAEAA